MKLIIGLGNPGKKYLETRHNIGHKIAEKLASTQNTKVFLTDTYMNESGTFVQQKVHFFKISPSDLTIIHDDLDLPVGEYKIQFDRGPAGHHGVESIIKHLGTQSFYRVRVGIGHPTNQVPVEDYVLQPFNSEEKLIINATIDKIVAELGH